MSVTGIFAVIGAIGSADGLFATDMVAFLFIQGKYC
jgi:hypothetical protein